MMTEFSHSLSLQATGADLLIFGTAGGMTFIEFMITHFPVPVTDLGR
jgi:hypothetical protein